MKITVTAVFQDKNQPAVHEDCTEQTVAGVFHSLANRYAGLKHLIVAGDTTHDFFKPDGTFLFGIANEDWGKL